MESLVQKALPPRRLSNCYVFVEKLKRKLFHMVFSSILEHISSDFKFSLHNLTSLTWTFSWLFHQLPWAQGRCLPAKEEENHRGKLFWQKISRYEYSGAALSTDKVDHGTKCDSWNESQQLQDSSACHVLLIFRLNSLLILHLYSYFCNQILFFVTPPVYYHRKGPF